MLLSMSVGRPKIQSHASFVDATVDFSSKIFPCVLPLPIDNAQLQHISYNIPMTGSVYICPHYCLILSIHLDPTLRHWFLLLVCQRKSVST